MDILKNYVNGELIDPLNGLYIDNFEPATGKIYGQIPDSGEEDVALAVEAAADAFPSWSVMSVQERGKILERIASLIEEQHESLAHIESKDNGKPVKLAGKVDIPRASANMRFYATAMEHFASEAHPAPGVLNYTTRTPIGIAGCISPWNLPLYLFTWKISPALATGNTVVAKPSELAPATAFAFSKICQEAGLPKGVLNIIHGQGKRAGEPLVAHPDVQAISFTGGTETGKRIATIAAPMFKKTSLELGGKNPNIIFEDCDIEEAVRQSVVSSFSNQGEICLCGSRILVQESIYDEFLSRFLEVLASWKVGDPLEADTKIGALISEAHLKKVQNYVALARKEGGEIRSGGKRVKIEGRCSQGYFFEPTVITGLSMSCRTNQEEIFGPVVTITPFHDDSDAVDMANDSRYGLSATIWTSNLSRGHAIANALEAGIIWVNGWLLRDLRTPFGGWKSSGVGREGGWEALRFFTEPKNICIKL
jgi:aminomuconate-semialdehyde/2-hydroxymuconate-6-semialdehyde dehydrogenase